ncbi:MAG: glycoside hydrolase family 99-like domain-containing protein, partial [Treponema sp.]|nr:glycoside hydrolase family 99-like domain-containing protein [Treponema sp.]
MNKQKYDVAAFIWPSYSGNDPRTLIFWPEGRGEWQTVRDAKPKFPGHVEPRKPLWGFVNEANPDVMEMQINAAVRHGVNVFIYDWYWYDNRPFLEECLNDGFLGAGNNNLMQFYVMWANHDATHLWDKRNSHDLST